MSSNPYLFFPLQTKPSQFSHKEMYWFSCFRRKITSLMNEWNINVYKVLTVHINVYRVLTVHGTEDEIIPVDDAKEFDKIISNHKLYILEGADHNYTAELHQVELATVVLDFIKTSLQQVNYAMPLTCISSSVSQLLQTSEVINHIQDFPQEGWFLHALDLMRLLVYDLWNK